jgi:hypothetical protein
MIPENLITLCLLCHATKDSPGHLNILLNAQPHQTPSYVKGLLWEVSPNLLVFAESLQCREIPAAQVLVRFFKEFAISVVSPSCEVMKPSRTHSTRNA